MGDSDAAENKEGREARQRQKPIKNIPTSFLIQIDKSQTSKEELEYDDDKWPAPLIDVGEQLWTHSYERSVANLAFLSNGLPC